MTEKTFEVTLTEMAKDIEYIKKDVFEIKGKLEKDFVTKEEFEPIKKIVYGLITLVLTGVMASALTLIIRK